MRLRYKKNAIPEMKESDYIVFEPPEYKGSWAKLFKNDKPIELEIGAGRGDFIVEKAMKNPGINYLALEMNTNAFVLASRKIEDNELGNVIGIVGKAENLEDFFKDSELSKIYLNFSTPWPKRRHHKRRLSHENFLRVYKKVLKPGSEIELKTDNLDFFEASLKYMEDFGMEILDKDLNLSEEESIVSEYERKFRNRNMPIYYLRARMESKDEKD